MQELAQRQHSSSGGAGGEVHVPGLANDQQQQQPDKDAAAAAAGDEDEEPPRSFQLAVARNADQVWTQVVGLQERAKLQVQAAAAAAAAPAAPDSAAPAAAAGGPSSSSAGVNAAGGGSGAVGGPAGGIQQQQGAGGGGDAVLDPLLAQLLAKAGSLQGCWGKQMFGLTDVEVLQLMEALPGADEAGSYTFVEQRGGWQKEREFLAKGRWARRPSMQQAAGGAAKKAPSKKQAPSAAAGAGAGSSPAGGQGGPQGKKRPHPASQAAAAAAAGAGAPSSLFGSQAPKRYRCVAGVPWGEVGKGMVQKPSASTGTACKLYVNTCHFTCIVHTAHTPLFPPHTPFPCCFSTHRSMAKDERQGAVAVGKALDMLCQATPAALPSPTPYTCPHHTNLPTSSYCPHCQTPQTHHVAQCLSTHAPVPPLPPPPGGPTPNRSMAKDERQVAEAVDKVLDKVIKRVETWWVAETAREAKKAEQAEARAAAKAARTAAKEKAKAEVCVGVGWGGGKGVGG